MRSPKLGSLSRSPATDYRYYAGYTVGFVEDVVAQLAIPPGGLLVDPWNGSGTTTVVAAGLGLNAHGFDLNPAAVMIGTARLLDQADSVDLVPIALEIIRDAVARPVSVSSDDLLLTWFGQQTASHVRALERAVARVLIDGSSPTTSSGLGEVAYSPLAATFYVLLFRCIRDLVKRHIGTNPTWIKRPDGRRIGVRMAELHALFVQVTRRSGGTQLTLPLMETTGSGRVEISRASSARLPLGDASVDAVICSPPYCTRLDYVIATLPELAILGLRQRDIDDLRREMIGSPLTRSIESLPVDLGVRTSQVLKNISAHQSKASATYYRNYFGQYFVALRESLDELHRILKPGAKAVLVVQDSYYKELHIDLPDLVGDMSQSSGWLDWSRRDFEVPRTMASINPKARVWRQSFRAVESAVTLVR